LPTTHNNSVLIRDFSWWQLTMSEQEFRQQCLQNFTKHKALDFMFQTIKEICAEANKTKDEKC
jgi:hypothetical protein